MKTKSLLALAVFILFTGCKNQQIDQNAFSSQSNISQAAIEKSQKLDQASYSGLEHLFGDTGNISSDQKFVLLIFGKNNCPWCDRLKEDIKENYAIQEALLKDFKSYYINLSYSKLHHLDFNGKKSQKETSQLSATYNIRPTPTSVFLDPQGETIFIWPGYSSPKQMQLILKFITTKGYENPQERQKFLKIIQTQLKGNEG